MAGIQYLDSRTKMEKKKNAQQMKTDIVKALAHLDNLASVCRRMKNLSKTLAHVEYVMGKFCIRQEHAEARWHTS